MNIFIKYFMSLLLLTPTTSFALDWENETRNIMTTGMNSYSLFQQLETKFKIKIDLRGKIINNSMTGDLKNATLKNAIIKILKDSDVDNYSLKFDEKTSILTVRILRSANGKDRTASNFLRVKPQLESLTREELFNVDGTLEVENIDKNIKNHLTYEEIEALKQGSVAFAQTKTETAELITPEHFEQLQKTTEQIKKEDNTDNGSISDAHIEQLKSEVKLQDEPDGTITPEQLKTLKME